MIDQQLLENHPLLSELSPDQIATLMPCARFARFPEGTVIFRAGEPADLLYLILSGRVTLEQHIPGKGDLQLESLGGGDMLGLSWLFPSGEWLLDARAVEATEALVLDAKCFRDQMDADTGLGLALAKQIILKLYQRLERARLQRLDVYRAAK